MKIFVRLATLVLLLVLALPMASHAMAGMYTAKYIDGPNIVLLTNNVHDTRAAMPITYNLRIYDIDGKPVTFGNIHILLKNGQKVLEEHNVRRSEHNDGTITLTYPRQGTYTLVARFLDSDKQVAWGEFPIVASKNPDQSWVSSLLSLPTAAGLIVGFGVAMLFSNRSHLPLPASVQRRKK